MNTASADCPEDVVFMGPRHKAGDDDQKSRAEWSSSPCGGGSGYAATPDSLSHSRIFCLGMAPTFIEAIWPPLNSIMVGMPRTP